jgi:hypothetical protein
VEVEDLLSISAKCANSGYLRAQVMMLFSAEEGTRDGVPPTKDIDAIHDGI